MLKINLITVLIVLSLGQWAYAKSGLQEIEIPQKLQKKLKTFEPSAALYLKQQDAFLVALDDTKKDAALLFLMDDQGVVDNEPVVIDGIQTMTDMEALFSDGPYIYIMSSQSRNKNGKELPERNFFVRGILNGNKITSTEVISLRPLLLAALSRSKDPLIAKINSKLDQLLETEASFVHNGKLFLGLKDPQPTSGTSLVLEIGDVDQIFRTQKINPDSIRVAYQFQFGSDNKLSDMILLQDRLILASTQEGGAGGSLWTYDEKTNVLTELQTYSDARPEGIAIGKNKDELLVVFDQGDEAALFTFERL